MASESALTFAQLLEQGPGDGDEDLCLVTAAPLGENHVTLGCGHKFGYEALYAELRLLREWAKRPYDTNYVTSREIRCPYCRSVTAGVLPYVPSLIPERTNGLNGPQSFCIGQQPCGHTLTRGARKGEVCGKAGFSHNGKAVCPIHWRSAKTAAETGEWSPVHEKLFRARTVRGLRELLRLANLPISGPKRTLVSRLVEGKVDYGQTSFT